MSYPPYPRSNDTLQKWNTNAKYLQDSIAGMVPLASKFQDAWANRENAEVYGSKILKYFEAIDRITLTMQECVIEYLEPSSYTRKQLEDRIQFKNKHSECHTKILRLQQKLVEEEEKYQVLLMDKQRFIHQQQELNTKISELQTQKIEEAAAEEQENKEMIDLKQQLTNWDKVQRQLRLQNDKFQLELQFLKQELNKLNQDNDNMKEQLLQIPLLEQKLEQQHEKLLAEIQNTKSGGQEDS